MLDSNKAVSDQSLDAPKMKPELYDSIRVKPTHGIPNPTYYVKALLGEFSDWAFDESRVVNFKGRWREEVFKVEEKTPLDLEIGTGNGFYFAHHARKKTDRCLFGIEIKYKPLIQAIRRALNDGCENARIGRYDARLVDQLFAENELNDVIIHHPDPFLKRKFHKHRLLQKSFLDRLSKLQKSGSRLFFKTDSEDYFDFAMAEFEKSSYEQKEYTRDLHNSEYDKDNFRTGFENIFTRQGLPIYYASFLLSK